MPHIVCYYHVVWATKYRQSLITPQIEAIIIEAIHAKSTQLKSEIYAINTVLDHIHIAVSIAPTIALADWIQQIKASSSYFVNRSLPNEDNTFRWQGGYSIHSFGKKALPFVLNYIRNQKQHHQNNTLEAYLEHIPDN